MLADGAGKAVGTRAVGDSVESQSSLRLATRRELFRIGHGVVVFLGVSAKDERCALSKEEEGEEGGAQEGEKQEKPKRKRLRAANKEKGKGKAQQQDAAATIATNGEGTA